MKPRRLLLPTAELHDRWWTIRFEKATTDDCWGECDHDARTIRVDPNASQLEQFSTLLHEVGHGVRGIEENHVLALEKATMKTIRLAHRVWPDLAEAINEPHPHKEKR